LCFQDADDIGLCWCGCRFRRDASPRGQLKDFLAEASDRVMRDIDAGLFQEFGDGAKRSLFAAQFSNALLVSHERLNFPASASLVASDSGIERLPGWLRRGSVSHLTAS